jgi:hypothetical protein
MKRELTFQLLRSVLPDPPWSEDALQSILQDLRALAEHKYNKYEMYQPGRLFFENLYLWLAAFEEHDRTSALEFVRQRLIFISREEFQQLAHVLYHDGIRQKHLELASTASGIPRHRLRLLTESPDFKRAERASLYVALSDGARVDYFRRQTFSISNEQVVAAYYVGAAKTKELTTKLGTALGLDTALFQSMFLIDDFCGSGRTLLREVIKIPLDETLPGFVVPNDMRAKLEYTDDPPEIEWNYAGPIQPEELGRLQLASQQSAYRHALQRLSDLASKQETSLKGALKRLSEHGIVDSLDPAAKVFLCPLLVTQYAIDRLEPLFKRLPPPLNRLEFVPGAVLENGARILRGDSPIADICERYYRPEFGDEHTGNVMFGYDSCGLPLVLHHNTPNNSLYFLWSRKWTNPLFARFERHGREGSK